MAKKSAPPTIQLNKIIDRIPVFRAMPATARVQVLLGTVTAAVIIMLAGGYLGFMRHGFLGLLVGAVTGFLLGIILGWLIGSLLERFVGSSAGTGRLEILLDQPHSRYMLGDTVSGQVLLQSHMPLRSKGGRITLLCQGYFSHAPAADADEGAKLERSSEQLYQQQVDVVPPGELRRGSVQGFAFEVPLPASGIPSHHGYLCIVKWSLHASLLLENEDPLETNFDLLVESQPVALTPEAEYSEVATSPLAQLSLTLPRAVYAEGEVVQGQVSVRPLVNFFAEELRMVLLRIENTPEGDNRRVYVVEWDAAKGVFRGQRVPGGEGTTYYWLEGEVNLMNSINYRGLEPQAYPFAITIPREWRPTMQLVQGSVTWKLGVTLVPEDEPELNVFHELFIHTCVPRVSQLTSS